MTMEFDVSVCLAHMLDDIKLTGSDCRTAVSAFAVLEMETLWRIRKVASGLESEGVSMNRQEADTTASTGRPFLRNLQIADEPHIYNQLSFQTLDFHFCLALHLPALTVRVVCLNSAEISK